MFNTGVQRPPAASSREPRRVRVHDCRGENKEVTGTFLETSGLNFNDFLRILHREFSVPSHERFVLATTDRTVLDFDKFEELQDGSTLYLLQQEDQALPMAMEERIMFIPHYDTLIQSGMYEYYASEGQNSLPYALAELIDNALSATAKNTGMRTIELKLLFDESHGKPALIVSDNGCGMNSKQLNNWAVYRLSKFTRENSTFVRQEGYVRPDPVPRSLNSDISYFGVGGKQAVFYIGDSTRMISKPVGSPDVHELVLSKEDFERKERNKEDIYSGIIRNRKPGDSSHVENDDERFLHALIAEEPGKESFTAVVITGILPEHVTFLKHDFKAWTRELALDWCTWPVKGAKVPQECYSRFSGVMFTDDRFKVSTNKLTFMDLELKLKNKDTIFTRIVNGQEKRSNIQREFMEWLKNCHEKLDKQVKFLGFRKSIERMDVPTKKMKNPWATFSSIEWDGKIYKTGQLVKSQKTQPILHGTVVQFLLYGDHAEDVFAAGGQVEVSLEPKALYDNTKIIPISKIDRTVTDESIEKNIENVLAKLPDMLKVDWPDGKPWTENGVFAAGTPLGALKIEILNKKGESISRMPTVGQGTVRKLSVKLTLVKHGPKKNEEILAFVAQHSAKWGIWFKKIDNLTNPGEYTLFLNTLLNESNATVFGGRELPSYKLKFTMKEGSGESFVMGSVSSTLHVGVPFDIPLQLKDRYGNSAMPLRNLQPLLKSSDMDLSYEAVDISGNKFTIKGVKARGKVLNYQQSKTYDLKVILPGLKKNTQTIKISLLPGNPHVLHVKTEDDPIIVENGNPARFNIEIHDEAGNITAHPKQIVHSQVQGLPLATIDCSSTGAGQLVTKPLNLKIIRGEPQKLKVQFWMPSQSSIASVVRELKVMPSTRVSLIELYSRDVENLVLKNNEKIEWPAGGSLENLFYKLYDETGREVPLTAEIVSMIKVNWKGDVNLEDLVQGKLPNVQVPTKVQEEPFYQVSYHDQSVSISFTVVPCPDEPKRLKATLLQNTLKLGEMLSGNINLQLLDQYDNATKTLTSNCVKHMTVEAEGLDKSAVAFIWQESNSSVEVTGIRFQCGTIGIREMFFTYLSYAESVIVKVTAGDPAQLKLVSGPKQPLQVLNDHSIPTPFIIQLSDKLGNPSPYQRVVVDIKSSPPALKVTTTVTSEPANPEGKAFFTVHRVSGPKGCYQLEFNGSFNNKPISGPSVNITVLPDPNKPVSLSVDYDTTAKFPAGGTFPVFSVTVVSDEGSLMTSLNPAAASMLLWEGGPSGETPPQTATELKCSKPMENERKDCFYFRDKEIPKRAGKHTIQFSLRVDKTKLLFSKQIIINVVANQPVKLRPDSQPQPPVLSCCKDIANRTLVKNMTLRIVDSYGNPAGQDLEGNVVVSIMSSSDDSNKNLPLFEGKINRIPISFVEGKVRITRLAIMENSPGEDGGAYTLLFKPEVSMVPTPLAPFELPFHFYNDELTQQKMSELLKKKNKLTTDVAVLEDFFTDFSKLLHLLREQYLTASAKEDDLRNVLIKRNVKIAQPVSIPDIDRLRNEKTAEADGILKMLRRVCSIHDNFRGQQDVLGMVGHLAYVQDDAAARVISWHIKGDMDCVITKTTEAARGIYDITGGRQQVMALNSVYVQPLNRPLPHIRNGHKLFDPPGNPVYARELLIYPHDKESCDIVFKNILRDTILIDDLDSANNYRRAVVQRKTHCPTILTREGDRISSMGKFGGAQNKAPPINTLQVFGAPPPQHYHTLKEEIDLLSQYQTALQKKERTEKEHDDHSEYMKSPELLKKKKDMEEKNKQLEEIGRQITLKSIRPVKRGMENAGEPSGIITKRAK
ncbi:structural maintenance of chromosomes flexible hinge domain-containing protein 1 isoform X2 [Xiphias gladius]|uniref:structural maintenance of chromosomes flexible hinge domain-containing protein 1 isoform X2 n=1 Tax=Xiphias gladius TaxID=8245 RepID=UPI001A97EB51|nr:structural maintenance of chromosomes flexible hinge domain-containing protein 1 isoform X2 [Xiphias gladius]